MDWMIKDFFQYWVKAFVDNILKWIAVRYYLRRIKKKIPGKYEKMLQNNGAYATDWNYLTVK